MSAESLSSSDIEGRLDDDGTTTVGFDHDDEDDDRRRSGERNVGDARSNVEGVDTLSVPPPGASTTSSSPLPSLVGAESAECAVTCASGNNNASNTRYTSLVMITQEPVPATCYQQVSVITTDTTKLIGAEKTDVVVRHTNWQEEAARRCDQNIDNGECVCGSTVYGGGRCVYRGIVCIICSVDRTYVKNISLLSFLLQKLERIKFSSTYA